MCLIMPGLENDSGTVFKWEALKCGNVEIMPVNDEE